MLTTKLTAIALLAALIMSPNTFAQQAGAREGQPATRPSRGMRGGLGGPRIVSPEVSADRHITFRFLAPTPPASASRAATSRASAAAI
jgi:hypothetical protein